MKAKWWLSLGGGICKSATSRLPQKQKSTQRSIANLRVYTSIIGEELIVRAYYGSLGGSIRLSILYLVITDT